MGGVSPEDIVSAVLALSGKCRYVALLDREGRKIAEIRRKGMKPLYEVDAAGVENLRTIFRFDTAMMRAKQSGPLLATVALYQNEHTLTAQTPRGLLFVSFDPGLDLNLIDQLLRIVNLR
jgi:hypothetical protein